ncbi:ergothioneine biosynthesis protein EgtB [Novosphingobium sp. BL-8H]|uniref:ergothioneine biosynthesis protein EgtB n=1 Tax=Novosphingobium sp. BL-8H TaxID=3127640 RepID=UPI003757FC37
MESLPNRFKSAEFPEALSLNARYRATRALSLQLVETLNEADAAVQSMPDASPAKWHLAHTTWFFETFLLRDHVAGYRRHDERWPFLFNSYYEAEGARVARADRGLLTRPTLAEVIDYRRRVDDALLAALPALEQTHGDLVELGIQHEQQHQELLLTDIKHLFAANPLGPVYRLPEATTRAITPPLRWIAGREGRIEAGHEGPGFAFDNELPRHSTWLAPHALASRTVTNGEWIEFMRDGGYATPSLWLSDGLDWVRRETVAAPLYWREGDGGWEQFTLAGWQPVQPDDPVCHVSFYEADAFAAWAGCRLPTEQEWEAAAQDHDPDGGNQLDRANPAMPYPAMPYPAVPCAVGSTDSDSFAALFGDVWEWTGSAYRPWPGYQTAPGAVGEYNGKFMSGQFVLKGGSCATPRGHMRASYRNFFHPHQRWQFTGLRLARSL